MTKTTYSKKFLNPLWQKKRLEILSRDKFTCQECGDAENTLHVHHRYYEFGKEPWDYENKLLVTLCMDCHETETHYQKFAPKDLANSFLSAGFLSKNFIDFMEGLHDMKLQLGQEFVSAAYGWAFGNSDMQKVIIDSYLNSVKTRAEKRHLDNKSLETADIQDFLDAFDVDQKTITT